MITGRQQLPVDAGRTENPILKTRACIDDETSCSRILRLFVVLLAGPQAMHAQTTPSCDVKYFGAAGDGVTLDSANINKAIDACAAAGGGTVFFPAGTYLSGTLLLKSNITLWLDSGAVLLGTKDLAQYRTAVEGQDWYDALILAKDTHNTAIVGHNRWQSCVRFKRRGTDTRAARHPLLRLPEYYSPRRKYPKLRELLPHFSIVQKRQC